MEDHDYGMTVEWETSIYKLQCALGTCSWTKLKQELETGRLDFVAVPIHDAWTACKPGEKASKSVDETNICYGNDCFSDYSDVSIKNIDILPDRQYISDTADSAQEQYS